MAHSSPPQIRPMDAQEAYQKLFAYTKQRVNIQEKDLELSLSLMSFISSRYRIHLRNRSSSLMMLKRSGFSSPFISDI